jgi:hypothetical protein
MHVTPACGGAPDAGILHIAANQKLPPSTISIVAENLLKVEGLKRRKRRCVALVNVFPSVQRLLTNVMHAPRIWDAPRHLLTVALNK